MDMPHHVQIFTMLCVMIPIVLRLVHSVRVDMPVVAGRNIYVMLEHFPMEMLVCNFELLISV